MLGGITPMPPAREFSGPIPAPGPIPPRSEAVPPREPPAQRDREPIPRSDPTPTDIAAIPPYGEARLKEGRTRPIVAVDRARKARVPPPAIRYGRKPANPPAYGISVPPGRAMASPDMAP